MSAGKPINDAEWAAHPQTIEARAQWVAVAQALGADHDCPDSVLAAAKAVQAGQNPLCCIHPDTLAMMRSDPRARSVRCERWTEMRQLEGYLPLYGSHGDHAINMERFRRPVLKWLALSELGVDVESMQMSFVSEPEKYARQVIEAKSLLEEIDRAVKL